MNGEDIFDINTSYGVIDDHVAAHERGVPAIDIIDISFGEGAENWEGHWHTHNDTIDKVSAESLGKIGRMIELGLRSSSWILENETNPPVENFSENSVQEDLEIWNLEKSRVAGFAALTVIFILFMLIFALDFRIKRK